MKCSDLTGRRSGVTDNTRLAVEEGGVCLFSVMLDVTEPAAEKEELKKCLQHLKVIMRQTEDVVFEWDIRNDTITYSENWTRKFGYGPFQEGISAPGLRELYIHPEDASE